MNSFGDTCLVGLFIFSANLGRDKIDFCVTCAEQFSNNSISKDSQFHKETSNQNLSVSQKRRERAAAGSGA
jgi:hypothetical protein